MTLFMDYYFPVKYIDDDVPINNLAQLSAYEKLLVSLWYPFFEMININLSFYIWLSSVCVASNL